MENQLYIDVIFAAKLHQSFTYQAKTLNQANYFPGQRVLVPLRNRQVIGFIISTHFNKPAFQVRPILEIIDTTPIFPAELFNFLTKLSDYYLAPLGMVLDSALPKEIKLQKFRTFYITDSNKKFPSAYHNIYQKIKAKPGINYTLLKRSFENNKLTRAIYYLKRHALITEKTDFQKNKQKKRIDKKIRLVNDAATKDIPGNATRQLELINYLKKHNHIFHHEIKQFSPSAIKKLEEKGIIHIERKDVTLHRLIDDFTPREKAVRLNNQQQAVYEVVSKNIKRSNYHGFLLHGVTGSGKTEVYIKLIETALQNNKSIIVLVPEIALTTHLANRFYGAFQDNIAIWHSGLTATERSNIWHKVSNGTIQIVIGARSALFMPMQKLGLIIVDEEHEQSYKQQHPAPRYHARDAALLRGFHSRSTVLLGSATPSLESHYNALMKKITKLKITKKFTDVMPNRIHMVDIKKEFSKSTSPVLPFSKFLIHKIDEKLQRNHQILLLHNRRGYSNFLICSQCGWTPECKHCDITLTYHKNINRLVCHYCDFSIKVPHKCPECGNKKFLYPGFGTQKIETILEKRFPKAAIARLDMDSTSKKGHMQAVLNQFESGDIDIIVGTQMIAKGLDFPNVSLVGVLNADVGLFLPDFRARERVFQLLYQVSGRAGRGAIEGEVVIQTFNPNDFTVNCAIQQDIPKFVNNEYSERNQANYPPFSRIAAINFTGKNHEKVKQTSTFSSRFLNQHKPVDIDILGPVSNPISKIKNLYRYFILLKSRKDKDPSGTILNRLLKSFLADKFLKKESSSVNITIDIDPSGLL